MDYKKYFIKDSFYLVGAQILIYMKGIILLPIIIKNFGASQYGGYVLLMTGIGFISAIYPLGVGFRSSRFMPSTDDKAEQCELFYMPVFFAGAMFIGTSLLLLLGRDPINTIIFKHNINFSMYLVILILLANQLYSSSAGFFRFTHKMKFYTIAEISSSYLMIAIMVLSIFVLNIKTINSLLWAHLLALMLVAIPLMFGVYRNIGFIIPKLCFRDILKDIRLGFPLVLSYVLDFILVASDRYVIALLVSTTAVGYYSPAYTLGSFIILVPKVFIIALRPLLSHAEDNNKVKDVSVLTEYSIKLFLIIAIPFIAGSYVLGKPLLEILANKEVANAAHMSVPIISLGILFYGLNLILSSVLFVKMKTKVMLGINAVSAILNLILNIVFIYIFQNILVAAISTFLSYFVAFIILNTSIKKSLEIKYDMSVMLKCLLSALLMGYVLYYARIIGDVKSAGGMLLLIVLGIGVYVGGLFVSRTFSGKELRFIQGFILEMANRNTNGRK